MTTSRIRATWNIFRPVMPLSLHLRMMLTLWLRSNECSLVLWDAISKSNQRVCHYWWRNDDWPTGVLVSIQLNWSSLTSCATQLKSTLNMEGRPREIRKRETTDGPYAAWRMVKGVLWCHRLALTGAAQKLARAQCVTVLWVRGQAQQDRLSIVHRWCELSRLSLVGRKDLLRLWSHTPNGDSAEEDKRRRNPCYKWHRNCSVICNLLQATN